MGALRGGCKHRETIAPDLEECLGECGRQLERFLKEDARPTGASAV